MKVTKITRGLGGTSIVYLDDNGDLELTTDFVVKIGLAEEAVVHSVIDGQGEGIYFGKHSLGKPNYREKR